MKLSPVEHFSHSTIRIECTLINGSISTGTGFFYSLNIKDGKHIPVIVTNKHVVKDASLCRFFLTLENAEGNPDVGNFANFEMNNFEARWLPHPDPSVDLCIMPLGPLLSNFENDERKVYYAPLDNEYIPTESEVDNMIGLEKIIMIGYPNGLWDEKNNLPIFRNGVLASNYKVDWNGKKEFLIDAACFPGSSGSPVFLFDLGGYPTKGCVVMETRIKLLGVLYAGPQHTVQGDVVTVPVATQSRDITIAGIPNNIGIIIKSERLLDFEDLIK